jgi:hypothetical protein
MITSKSLEENGKESLTTSTIMQNGRNKNTFMTTKGKPLTIVALRLLWELGQVDIALPLLLRSHNVFSRRWEIPTGARNSKRRQNANRSLGEKKHTPPVRGHDPRSKRKNENVARERSTRTDSGNPIREIDGGGRHQYNVAYFRSLDSVIPPTSDSGTCRFSYTFPVSRRIQDIYNLPMRGHLKT